MRVTINNSIVVYDDTIKPQPVYIPPVIPTLDEDRKKLLKRVLPEVVGIVGVTSIMSCMKPALAMAADAGAKLVVKEQSIIHTLQTIATPAAIAIAIWGLIEWAVLDNPKGKKKIWESLWLLLGIKFIPDIWMTIAA